MLILQKINMNFNAKKNSSLNFFRIMVGRLCATCTHKNQLGFDIEIRISLIHKNVNSKLVCCSGMLSFIEHEVQQQLLHKMQMCNMNSCWSVRITLTVTENAVIGLAVGTGLHLAALPFPHLVNLPSKVGIRQLGGM